MTGIDRIAIIWTKWVMITSVIPLVFVVYLNRDSGTLLDKFLTGLNGGISWFVFNEIVSLTPLLLALIFVNKHPKKIFLAPAFVFGVSFLIGGYSLYVIINRCFAQYCEIEGLLFIFLIALSVVQILLIGIPLLVFSAYLYSKKFKLP